ncbi:MAG: hypothetical protein ABI576_13070 [Flavobacterium sp.]
MKKLSLKNLKVVKLSDKEKKSIKGGIMDLQYLVTVLEIQILGVLVMHNFICMGKIEILPNFNIFINDSNIKYTY